MQVEIHEKDGTLIAGLSGDWTLDRPVPRFGQLVEDRAPEHAAHGIGFDTAALGEWDSSLLTFLLQGMNYCDAHGLQFRKEGLPENIAGLLELARAVPEADVQVTEEEASLPARIGSRGLAVYDSFLASVTSTGEVADSFVRFLGFRVRLRWRDFWLVVQSNSSGALPIVTLISFLVGLIIAFLGAVVLRRFGAGYYVSYLVGFGMPREMGALMTGIIMAGRTGAAFAAELGGGPSQVKAASPGELADVSIGLRRPQVASYLDAPLIVVRRGPHQIGFSEFHCWGGHLGGGINRAVARHLSDRGSFSVVDVAPRPPRERYDYLIQLHVLRFEGLMSDERDPSEGVAHMLVTWEIILQEEGAVLSRGSTDFRGRGWKVGDHAGLVTLLDAGLGVLSDDLVAAIGELARSPGLGVQETPPRSSTVSQRVGGARLPQATTLPGFAADAWITTEYWPLVGIRESIFAVARARPSEPTRSGS